MSPRRDDASLPLIAIGASAGGLAAVRTFLENTPADLGAALVVVVHLPPERESHFAELLRASTPMPVLQVSERTELEPNHVYVIPPNRNLAAIDTHLQLSELEERRAERAPIDHFFRTVAASHGSAAVAVVLTGTGTDGSVGARTVREAGGLLAVQDPADAEHDSMPHSAIESAGADVVAEVRHLPQRIADILRHAEVLRVPEAPDALEASDEAALRKILAQVRILTGRDFRQYKQTTVLRRLRHRMQVRTVRDLPAYAELLERDPSEAERLGSDLLITVTGFFRDAEAFERLERDVVPQLFAGKGGGDQVRVWAVGSSTGEEAYSLAILLLEHATSVEDPPDVQVFASDVHAQALEGARLGRYPEGIEQDVPEARLRRFFLREEAGGYRVKKSLREAVLFAHHDVLADPPFSRIDLISCRNVLIYLRREVQGHFFDIAHYALRPDGYLVLGSSESLERSTLFRVVDERHRIYRRHNVAPSQRRVPNLPVRRHVGRREEEDGEEPGATGREETFGSVHHRMVERHAPPSILIDRNYDVVHLSEHAGRYLRAPGGETTQNVLKQARSELRIELRSLIYQALEKGQSVKSRPIPMSLDAHERQVSVWAKAAPDADLEGFVLLIFEEHDLRPRRSEDEGSAADGETVATLEEELEETRQRLRIVIEEYESSQEEMRSSNEELQSINEELKSTAEELETSKEELESMNEELVAVTHEYRDKIDTLNALTHDQRNLLSAGNVAAFLLDRDLRIRHFTPEARAVFNVVDADVGRSIGHLTHKFGAYAIAEDARSVFDDLAPVERELESDEGRRFRIRFAPNRSGEDAIDGVLVDFVDVTAIAELRRRVERLSRELEQSVPAAGSAAEDAAT